jgi:membrane fusion protein, heavy metal efflux system
MNTSATRFHRFWAAGAMLLAVVALLAAAVTYRLWLPHLRPQPRPRPTSAIAEHEHEHEHEGGHADDDEDAHAAHSDATSIVLSAKGLKNIGFEPWTVSRGPFTQTIALPALVVERPGRSQLHITASLTGIVTRIYAVEGVAVEPASPMFDIRLTHEDLVVAQRDFLQTAESLDVVRREIERLKTVGEGVIAGRRILEQEYEQQKLEASLRAERQALLLHGLTDEQIDQIVHTRHLLQSLSVHAPVHTHEDDTCNDDHLFHVQQLPVTLGQQVKAGELLCVLADHCELFIEGRAFEDDAMRLREAARHGWDITARVVSGRGEVDQVEGLKLLYLADRVDTETRAFRFYLRLPNMVALDQVADNGRRFIAWRFNPGQRLELHVPVERWEDRIIVPREAIVDEGAEAYVYAQHGDHFDRVNVHVEYRDHTSAVIANDGSIQPGDIIAARGAYQIHLAIKNKAGGGIDPHAGHQH